MADSLLSGVSLYLLVGAVLTLLFLPLVGFIDRAARGAYAFRLLLIPGAVLLWPLVLLCTLRALRRAKVRVS